MSSHRPGKHDVNPMTLSFKSAITAPSGESSEASVVKAIKPWDHPLIRAVTLIVFIAVLPFIGAHLHL